MSAIFESDGMRRLCPDFLRAHSRRASYRYAFNVQSARNAACTAPCVIREQGPLHHTGSEQKLAMQWGEVAGYFRTNAGMLLAMLRI